MLSPQWGRYRTRPRATGAPSPRKRKCSSTKSVNTHRLATGPDWRLSLPHNVSRHTPLTHHPCIRKAPRDTHNKLSSSYKLAEEAMLVRRRYCAVAPLHVGLHALRLPRKDRRANAPLANRAGARPSSAAPPHPKAAEDPVGEPLVELEHRRGPRPAAVEPRRGKRGQERLLRREPEHRPGMHRAPCREPRQGARRTEPVVKGGDHVPRVEGALVLLHHQPAGRADRPPHRSVVEAGAVARRHGGDGGTQLDPRRPDGGGDAPRRRRLGAARDPAHVGRGEEQRLWRRRCEEPDVKEVREEDRAVAGGDMHAFWVEGDAREAAERVSLFGSCVRAAADVQNHSRGRLVRRLLEVGEQAGERRVDGTVRV
mmetsp:Transcript_36949/g.110420  ORF Transcript_36949/g.110420 Transcript_36949/m.110420 type:complete len:369 (-) Transcript_36949:80-1186(-)